MAATLLKHDLRQWNSGTSVKMWSHERLISVYERYAPLVRARACRIVGSESDDIAHDVFLRLMTRPPKEGSLRRWLLVTTTNLCIDRIRKKHSANKSHAAVFILRACCDGPKDPELLYANKEFCLRLVAKTKTRRLRILIMVFVDEMSYQEVAEVEGISTRAVAEHISRFRRIALKRARRLVSGLSLHEVSRVQVATRSEIAESAGTES